MKSYTDISQSKKLADILLHITADNTYERIVIAGCNLDIPEEQQYVYRNIPFAFFSGIGVPCWSLAALLDVINTNYYITLYHDGVAWNIDIIHHDNVKDKHNVYANTPIDACVEIIIELHEQKLL